MLKKLIVSEFPSLFMRDNVHIIKQLVLCAGQMKVSFWSKKWIWEKWKRKSIQKGRMKTQKSKKEIMGKNGIGTER